ncbi:MAG: hypothetical protein V1756_01265 [Patescibacteria group bacterium]
MILTKNSQFKDSLDSSSQSDIVIIFNLGGWGNAPLEKADDLAPIARGVEKKLNDLGHKPAIVLYKRTKEGFLSKFGGIAEILNNFKKQSRELAGEINDFLEHSPETGIIMVGLSSGAAFVDETMKKISGKFIGSVYAIEVGLPFWRKKADSKNILRLDNGNKDAVSKGDVKCLLTALLKAPFIWVNGRISGKEISFPLSFHVSSHEYPWGSPEVGEKITSFLEDRFGK